jgi:hypothetical protein
LAVTIVLVVGIVVTMLLKSKTVKNERAQECSF